MQSKLSTILTAIGLTIWDLSYCVY